MKKLITLLLIYSCSALHSQCWSKVVSGQWTSYGIKTDGTLWGWGNNEFGRLGDGTTTPKYNPTQIGNDTWIEVSSLDGANHVLAIKEDGTLWAWGWNNSGQLGDGTNEDKNIPVQIGGDNDWKFVACYNTHSLAIKTNGTLWAWGWNSHGQLGDGTEVSKNYPVQIGFENNWAKISAGHQSSFAIKSDGTLWAWGDNNYGQLGNGEQGNNFNPNPLQIGTENNWKNVSSGIDHTLGIKDDGTIWEWGNKYYYSPGNPYQTTPLQVGNEDNWLNVDQGGYHSTAVKIDGAIWSWGFGYLGDGNYYSGGISYPILVSGNDWLHISSGLYGTMALKNDGNLWSWGDNRKGQIGDGTTIDRSTPVEINCPESNLSVVEVFTSKKNIFYPNPTNDYIILNPELNIKIIDIYNLDGTLLKSFLNFDSQIDLRFLKKGNYILKLKDVNQKIHIKKIIKN